MIYRYPVKGADKAGIERSAGRIKWSDTALGYDASATKPRPNGGCLAQSCCITAE